MRVRIANVAEWLNPRAERDPGFCSEIRRGSVLSLQAIGALEITVPLLMLAAGLGVLPIPITNWREALPNLLFAVLGIATMASSRLDWARRHARFLIGFSIWASSAVMIWSALLLARDVNWLEHHLLGYTVLVLFGAAAAVPLKPWHTLLLGFSTDSLYNLSLLIARHRLEFLASEGYGPLQHVFTLVVTLMCTALTASVYRQRHIGYLRHLEALRASERLRDAESRLLISENAATLGRMAAAVSHELNSPIGVLASSVETLSEIAHRMGSVNGPQQPRLRSVLDDVTRSGRESAQRLRAIVARMQRFANLDRADVQSANLNDLLTDVIALVASTYTATPPVNVDFKPLPRFLCRPQQFSSVFTNLLTNALDSLEPGGRVFLSTAVDHGNIIVQLTDNGRGIPEDQLATLFDPAAFHVAAGRVQAGHWSLFSCRQIIREHGGDIEVSSASGQGTTVRVTLPAGVEPGAGIEPATS